MNRTVVAIAGQVGRISIERPVTNQPKIESGSGVGIIHFGACLILIPVHESVPIGIYVKEVEIHSAEVPVDLGQVEPAQSIVPVLVMLPDFISLRIAVSGSVHENLKIIAPALFNGQGEVTVAIDKSLSRRGAAVGFEGPNDGGAVDHSVVTDGAGYGGKVGLRTWVKRCPIGCIRSAVPVAVYRRAQAPFLREVMHDFGPLARTQETVVDNDFGNIQSHLVGASVIKEHDLVGGTENARFGSGRAEVTLQVVLGVVLVEGDPVVVAGVNLHGGFSGTRGVRNQVTVGIRGRIPKEKFVAVGPVERGSVNPEQIVPTYGIRVCHDVWVVTSEIIPGVILPDHEHAHSRVGRIEVQKIRIGVDRSAHVLKSLGFLGGDGMGKDATCCIDRFVGGPCGKEVVGVSTQILPGGNRIPIAEGGVVGFVDVSGIHPKPKVGNFRGRGNGCGAFQDLTC